MTATKRRKLRKEFEGILNEAGITGTEAEILAERLADAAFPERKLSEQQRMVGVLERRLHLSVALNQGRVVKLAADVLRAGFTAEEVDAYFLLPGEEDTLLPGNPLAPLPGLKSIWCADWRSKQGRVGPNEHDLRSCLASMRSEFERARKALVIDV